MVVWILFTGTAFKTNWRDARNSRPLSSICPIGFFNNGTSRSPPFLDIPALAKERSKRNHFITEVKEKMGGRYAKQQVNL